MLKGTLIPVELHMEEGTVHAGHKDYFYRFVSDIFCIPENLIKTWTWDLIT